MYKVGDESLGKKLLLVTTAGAEIDAARSSEILLECEGRATQYTKSRLISTRLACVSFLIFAGLGVPFAKTMV